MTDAQTAAKAAPAPARPRPPFRADHVGSLLRPQPVREARAQHAAGALSDAALAAVEDAAIADAAKRQEAVGLRAVTDGEIRRASWSGDFLERLKGVVWTDVDTANFKGVRRRRMLKVTGKLAFSGHPMIDHFRFVKGHTSQTAKLTIPSPTMLASASRDWRLAVDRSAYPDLDAMFADLAVVYRAAIAAFYDAGCRYLQLDDCSFAFVCDPALRTQMADRGDDPDRMVDAWVELINASLADKPADMVVSTHLCRGNLHSTWFAEGGYEPVAEALLARTAYDAFFLEYDTDRAGGFEPLRHLPASSKAWIVLGLITSKSGALEARDDVKRRIDQAAAHLDLDRLALSPQCGFASTEEGNTLSEDEQWAKLAEVVEIAREVWGG